MEAVLSNPWFVPAVLIAIIGLFLQGLKAGWDLWFSIRNQSRSQENITFQRLSTFLAVVEGIPISDPEKLGLKLRMIRETLTNKKANLLGLISDSIRNIQ